MITPTWRRNLYVRRLDRRGRKLWIASAHAPTKTAEDDSKDVFYYEINALMHKMQVVTVEIDANAKMGPEQESGVRKMVVRKKNISQLNIRKSRAVWDVAFDSDHSVLFGFKIRFRKRNRGVPSQPKIDIAAPKYEKCRTKFRRRVSIDVGEQTWKKLFDADSFTKCIQEAVKKKCPFQMPRKTFALASVETK
ncbi:hypothetical protein RB195_019385 [Necator americanus]|uniref:Uncharacterized protein n=1 Tax=Necator americanus TaxID=51031 RepID=A0ABR1CFJ0_NECAM